MAPPATTFQPSSNICDKYISGDSYSIQVGVMCAVHRCASNCNYKHKASLQGRRYRAVFRVHMNEGRLYGRIRSLSNTVEQQALIQKYMHYHFVSSGVEDEGALSISVCSNAQTSNTQLGKSSLVPTLAYVCISVCLCSSVCL